jgi:hypothetical protein
VKSSLAGVELPVDVLVSMRSRIRLQRSRCAALVPMKPSSSELSASLALRVLSTSPNSVSAMVVGATRSASR